MIKSMTGFASRTGADAPHSWTWELRGVNGRGLDLRLRVPDWIDGLEAGLRKRLTDALGRGNVTCNLRLARAAGEAGLRVNEDQLQSVLRALHRIEARAMDDGVSLAPSTATDIIALRGVLEETGQDADTTPLRKTLMADFDALLADFDDMRASEGAALAGVLRDQLDEIEALATEAAGMLSHRAEDMAASLRETLGRILDNTDGAEPDRVAQELALIAVKTDVREELDRLTAHVAAARSLLEKGGPVGRKLDFLMQEFNREANTLCAKAQYKDLTRVGLALKAVIDQMREQVQNVE